MERSEPTLVPGWLKATANVTGAGTTNHHLVSSSSHSDESGAAPPTRNRSSFNVVDFDTSHLDRNSSSYFRRSSSSNGSMGHDKDASAHSRSYSSFGRSYRDRDWDKDILDFREKDRSNLGDKRVRDFSDADLFTSRAEKDLFRRSQSMSSGKRVEMRPRRVVSDTNNNNHSNHNGAAGGNKVISIHKATFERDFPSLGAEERQGVDRVMSPGLCIAAQSLPIGSSAMMTSNGWTSALAEAPAVTGSSSMGLLSVQQTAASASASSSSGSPAPSTTTGLNMAETLAQAPARARAAPQLSIETQRLEELAIKQSRQLIPMTPSMPKNSVLNSEKLKPKASSRIEMSVTNKVGQQHMSVQPVNHPLRGGMTRSDIAKPSNGGKLLVLKPARENGTSHATRDSSSPTNAGKIASNPLAVTTSSVGSAPMRSPNNSKPALADRKTTALPPNKTSSMEKKPINSQAQSRNDFFNLMRKKTSTNSSSGATDPGSISSPTALGKSNLTANEVTSAVSTQGGVVPALDQSSLNADHGAAVGSNGDAYEHSRSSTNDEEKYSSCNVVVIPDEEEEAFLRSLGWEEDAGEEGGLTKEEINTFLQEVMKLGPSSGLFQTIQSKLQLQLQLESQVDDLSGESAPGSSESKSEA